MATTAFIILAAYLWGGIPSSYLVARYLKGIDIREYGSGNVGASNVSEHVGKGIGLLLGTFDCLGKGTLPVVALSLMDQSMAVRVAAGLAAVTGHNWSPYIRFTGGRGVATAIGVMIGFLMWKEFLVGAAILGIIGRLLTKDLGFWTFVAMLALPVLAYVFEEPPERVYMVYMGVGIALILILKRLTSNWERPRGDYPLLHVLVFRLLWDRDVPRKKEWTGRRPVSR